MFSVRVDEVKQGMLVACAFESGHLTPLNGAGEGEVVSKEVGKEERGARGGVDRRSDSATSVDVEIDPHRILAAARPTLLFRPL